MLSKWPFWTYFRTRRRAGKDKTVAMETDIVFDLKYILPLSENEKKAVPKRIKSEMKKKKKNRIPNDLNSHTCEYRDFTF